MRTGHIKLHMERKTLEGKVRIASLIHSYQTGVKRTKLEPTRGVSKRSIQYPKSNLFLFHSWSERNPDFSNACIYGNHIGKKLV